MQTVKIPAKVNLSLYVTGRRADGYHELDSVTVSVAVFDAVCAERTESGLSSEFSGRYADKVDPLHNTALTAAELFCGRYGGGARISVTKGIPVGAGLGGSSADAAGVLRALCAEYGIPADSPEIFELAKGIGCDVPYMLRGGCARVTGVGERVEPLPGVRQLYLIILTEPNGVNTKECYQKFDESGMHHPSANNDRLIAALKAGVRLERLLFNDLYPSACLINPSVRQNRTVLPAPSVMTGSGSACIAVFYDKIVRDCAVERLAIRGITDLILTHTI
jgi:4-diphosphocytidyl-2-C-methyl-D-erythritol kinase